MLTDAIKPMIAAQIRQMTGASRPLDDFLHPVGDPGLFGPKSVTWQVHAHFASMMVGGLSSLLIQAMHHGALAGVWDHSNFRDDLKARLGRTAYFIVPPPHMAVQPWPSMSSITSISFTPRWLVYGQTACITAHATRTC
uniref:oxygenase MpaB family protein n=2 Tax=Orrella sp. TaxID=1921583 RepID=UPI0040486B8F